MNLSNATSNQIKDIVQKLQEEFNALKNRNKILRRQNFLGALFFSISILSILLSLYLWMYYDLYTVAMILWIATNENKTPELIVMAKGDSKPVYKFLSFEECNRWCKGY